MDFRKVCHLVEQKLPSYFKPLCLTFYGLTSRAKDKGDCALIGSDGGTDICLIDEDQSIIPLLLLSENPCIF